MKITKEWLQKESACAKGIDWFLSQNESEHILVIKALIKELWGSTNGRIGLLRRS